MAVGTVFLNRTRTAVTDRNYSPDVWKDCPLASEFTLRAGIAGFADGDDFKQEISEDAVDDVYQKYIDTSNTIRLGAMSTTNPGGVLELVTDASDNDGPVVQRHGANAGSTAIGPYFIGNTAGSAFRTWFEARYKVSSIADDVMATFCGLAGVGRAADSGVLDDNAGDVVDSVSFLGFRSKHVNSGTAGTNALVDFLWQDAGQTAPTVGLASAHTFVADTYVKLGFYYNPFAPAAKKIRIYVNNVEQTTYGTTTQIDAATFPENDAMAFVIASKTGSAAVSTLTIDWWRCVQVYEGGYSR